MTPDAPWLTFDNSTMQLSGIVTDNAYAANYTVTIKAHDPWDDTDLASDSFDFEIKPNLEPVTTEIPAGFYSRVPNATSWSFGSSFAYDPEGQPIIPTITVNGTSPPSWIIIDETTYTFTVQSPTQNEWQGIHKFVVYLDDGFHNPPF